VVSDKNDAPEELRIWLSGAKRVVIAGIGNPLRMDDFVGIKIVQGLHGRVSEKVKLIECETVPESFTHQIIDSNPTHVLLIDAAILDLKPGVSRLIEPEQLAVFPAFSTHMLPLRIFCEYVSKMTEAKITLLLIEPEMTDFGETLSPEVEKTAEYLTNLLVRILP